MNHYHSAVQSRYDRCLMTLLHTAAVYGNLTPVNILLYRGADSFALDSNGLKLIEGIDNNVKELVDLYDNAVVGILRQRLYTTLMYTTATDTRDAASGDGAACRSRARVVPRSISLPPFLRK